MRSELDLKISPSGLADTLSWKIHSYLVLDGELRLTGQDCASDKKTEEDRLRCDKETRGRIIDIALRNITAIEGDIFEFGVFEGESLRIFAESCPERRIYGFDSFEGMPEDWYRYPSGEICRPKGTYKTTPPLIENPNVTLVKGLFEESLPRFLIEWSGLISLIHVDCVLYQSTMDCLLPILPFCQIGTIIIFDEYYNYSDFAEHEWLAWRKVKAKYGVETECIAYDSMRAAFKIVKLDMPTDNAYPIRSGALRSFNRQAMVNGLYR